MGVVPPVAEAGGATPLTQVLDALTDPGNPGNPDTSDTRGTSRKPKPAVREHVKLRRDLAAEMSG